MNEIDWATQTVLVGRVRSLVYSWDFLKKNTEYHQNYPLTSAKLVDKVKKTSLSKK